VLHVQDAAAWRYVGGEVYNESIDRTFKYADVCKRLNDKFGDTVSFKYVCPDDAVDPENLIHVSDDSDLEVRGRRRSTTVAPRASSSCKPASHCAG
jgi:hypothetical protein